MTPEWIDYQPTPADRAEMAEAQAWSEVIRAVREYGADAVRGWINDYLQEKGRGR